MTATELSQALESVALISDAFIGIWDSSFRPAYLNPAALRMIGVDSARQAPRLPDLLAPGDLSAGEGNWDGEVRIHARDGSEVTVLRMKVTPVRDRSGRPLHWTAVGSDQTMLRSAFRELSDFKFALDRASIVAMTDARGVITYVNDKFCEISRYSRDELIGHTHRVVNSGHHTKEFFSALWATIASGKVWEGEIRNRAKTGDHYWVHTFIVPFLDRDGGPYQFLSIRNDITRKKEAEHRLQISVRAKDDFISIASHELKTPVTTLKLQTQFRRRLFERGDPEALTPERLRKMLENDEKQVNRLTRLIDDMLDMSRIGNGRLSISPQRFDIRELVMEILERMGPLLESAGCAVSFEPGDAVEGCWDRYRIEQVIVNLVTNAAKYGSGKPVRLAVGAGDGFLELRVEDQGDGIAPQDHDRIFQPYERAVSMSEVSGLGLGLYIARQIVDAHGGSLRVQSAPGAGAAFTVRLPLDSGSGSTR